MVGYGCECDLQLERLERDCLRGGEDGPVRSASSLVGIAKVYRCGGFAGCASDPYVKDIECVQCDSSLFAKSSDSKVVAKTIETSIKTP